MESAPHGRTKNIRIPEGKQHEYSTDQAGNLIHTTYGEDDQLDAIVLPSASGLDRLGSGGQHRADFDPLGRNIPQNIVLFNDNGMQLVTRTTGRELAQVIPRGPQLRGSTGDSSALSPEEADRLGEQAEDLYRGLAVRRQAAAAPAVQPLQEVPAPPAPAPRAPVPHIEEDYSPMAMNQSAKAGAKKKRSTKKSRRVVESEEPATQETMGTQRANPLPIDVIIEAPFGKLQQKFSSVFIDGGNLVLCTDSRYVPLYMLPEVTDPIAVRVSWAGQSQQCIHAGICFTLPHVPVTFTVLLIDNEGQVDGQGQPSEGWPDQV